MASRTPFDGFNTQLPPVAPSDLTGMRTLPAGTDASMDPRLQLALLNRNMGRSGRSTASASGDEVPVIARVTSPELWSGLPGVRLANPIGKTPDESWIVTGRVSVDRIEEIHAHPAVLSLKAAQSTHPTLGSTISEMELGTWQAQGRPPAAVPGILPPWVQHAHQWGDNVIVGIVDSGCDYAHRNFRHADGSTRLLALWDQSGKPAGIPLTPASYGAFHFSPQIDAALRTDDPYAALGYNLPVDQPPYQLGAHGTHVMDIAAGNGRGSQQRGIAPKASLIFVDAHLPNPAFSPEAVNHTMGDTVQLLDAVRFIFTMAGSRPCVVNISLGTNGGPHDGTSLVEQGLDAMVEEAPNRAIVIAAGNAQESGIHTSGTVPPRTDHPIVWRTKALTAENGQELGMGGEVELWYPRQRRLEVTLTGPDGIVMDSVKPGESRIYADPGNGGQTAILVVNRLDDPNNRDNVIGIWLALGTKAADWTIHLKSADGQSVDYHAWIERLNYFQSEFAQPVATHTLGSISAGRSSIVVGSYDAHVPDVPLSSFSSAGPTRDGRQKPELSAPGHDVLAAWSRTGTGATVKSGTSMAAPAVTGLIALIFARSFRKGQHLSITELRERLLRMARRSPAGTADWHPRYGCGRASATAMLEPFDHNPSRNPDVSEWNWGPDTPPLD